MLLAGLSRLFLAPGFSRWRKGLKTNCSALQRGFSHCFSNPPVRFEWLKPGREARLKPARDSSSFLNPPAEAGGKEERAEAR